MISHDIINIIQGSQGKIVDFIYDFMLFFPIFYEFLCSASKILCHFLCHDTYLCYFLCYCVVAHINMNKHGEKSSADHKILVNEMAKNALKLSTMFRVIFEI